MFVPISDGDFTLCDYLDNKNTYLSAVKQLSCWLPREANTNNLIIVAPVNKRHSFSTMPTLGSVG